MVEFNLNSFKSTYRDYARAYTFYAKIDNPVYFQEDNQYLVKSTTLPSTEIDEVEANWQGHKYKLASTPTYNDFTITFNVDIDSDIHTKMMRWSTYLNNPVDNLHGMPSVSTLYFSDITLKHLNPQGAMIKTYTLIDAWPKSVGEITLDYTSKEVSSFDVTFAYQFHTVVGIN